MFAFFQTSRTQINNVIKFFLLKRQALTIKKSLNLLLTGCKCVFYLQIKRIKKVIVNKIVFICE